MLNAQMEEKHLKQWNKSAPQCVCSCIWSCGGHGFACGSDVNPCVVAKQWDMTYSFFLQFMMTKTVGKGMSE